MKLVLRSDVDGLGNKGDIVDVSDGYGRNYLLPKGMAMRAAAGTEQQAEGMRAARAVQDAAQLAAAQELASRMVATPVRIAARASGEGRLFGSVTANDIALAAFVQASASIDQKVITLTEPIKELGEHSVQVKPHPEVEFPMTIEVVADEA